MMAWLEGRLWQAIAVGAACLVVIAALFAVVADVRLRSVKAERDRLELSIRAPGTGWAARLTQCRQNTATLEQARATQNAATESYAHAASARVAAAEKQLDRVRAQHADDVRRFAALTRPLQSNDGCGRMSEADQRLLDILK